MRYLLIFAVIFSAGIVQAASNPPSPTPSKAAEEPKGDTKQQEKKSATDKHVTKDSPALVEISPSSVIKEETTNKTEKRYDYSSSEWWMVYLAGTLAFITFFLALYTGKLYRATVALGKEAQKTGDRQAGEMQDSLKISRDAADAAQKSADASLVRLRPWVSCHVEIAGPLKYTSEGDALFELRFIVKNVGQAPAMGVRLSPFLTLFSPKHEHSIINLQRMAEHNRGMPAGGATMIIPGGTPIVGSELGLLLFPDETCTFNYRIPIKRSEIEKSCEDIKPNMHFWPELCGLVTYTYPLATVRADTGFVYRIEKLGGIFELGEPVALESMSLSDHALWSGFAT